MDLSPIPLVDLLREIGKRNVSYVIALLDHNELQREKPEGDDDYQWFVESQGPLPVCLALEEILIRHLETIKERDIPARTDE